MCSAFHLARSSFYEMGKRVRADGSSGNDKQKLSDEKIWKKIEDWWNIFPGIGYRKLAKYIGVNKKRVLRILQEKRGRIPRKAKHTNQRRFPNLIQQTLNDLLKNKHDPRHQEFRIKNGKSWKKNGKEFKPRKLLIATRPYQIWQCDWKEIDIKIIKIKVYLFLIIDTYTRQIKGFHLSLVKDAKSALKAVRSAIEKSRGESERLKLKDENENKLFIPEKLIIHSDQGGAYLSNEYIAYLEHVGVRISMADRGKPTQNPYIEAFISLLVRFWINHFEFLNYHELHKSINKFIYRYNTLWLHGEIGDIAPDARLEQFKSSLVLRR